MAVVRGDGLPSPRVVQEWSASECWGFLRLYFSTHGATSGTSSGHEASPSVTVSSLGSVMRKTVNDLGKEKLSPPACPPSSLASKSSSPRLLLQVHQWPDETTRIWSWGAGHHGALGLVETFRVCFWTVSFRTVTRLYRWEAARATRWWLLRTSGTVLVRKGI